MTIQDMIDGHLDPSVEHLPINSRTQVSFVRLACLSCPRDVFLDAMPFFASCPLVAVGVSWRQYCSRAGCRLDPLDLENGYR